MVYRFGKQCNEKSPKATDPNYECNTVTGRWVKKKVPKRRNSKKSKRRSSARKSSVRRSSARKSSARRSSVRKSSVRRSLARKSSARRSSARRSKSIKKSKLVNLSTCNDTTDYLNSLEDLDTFPPGDIVSIKFDNVFHCFPKESIINALEMGPIIFASPHIRYKISSFIINEYGGLVDGEIMDDALVELAEEVINGKNNWGINDRVFDDMGKIIEFYRFYKWPLTSNIIIPSLNMKEFIESDEHEFEFKKVGKIKDVSTLRAHGVGAVHGEKDIYIFVPLGKKPKKRELVKQYGFEAYYANKTEYRNFIRSISKML